MKNYLHLNFLVFIAGFIAILGELISIYTIFRMFVALVLMFVYVKAINIDIKI